MSRYLEFQNGAAINELNTSGVPSPPLGRFMVDVSNRLDVVVGMTVVGSVLGLAGIVDIAQLLLTTPILVTSPPVLSSMEVTVNKIAAKVGAI